MIGFFKPRYVKEGQEMLKAARKMLHYKRDLLRPADLETIESEYRTLKTAVKERNREKIEESGQKLDELFARHFPPKHSAMRENCEVFLVAIVIAVGVRSYFLQPFTIPTGSMQPTLNGIIATVTEEPPPNPLIRVLHFGLYGRTYINLISKTDDIVEAMRPVKRFVFFNYTEIRCREQTFLAPTTIDKLQMDFRVAPGRVMGANEVLARGYVDTGDHVFVDKTRYHFVKPALGDVFVFNTVGLPTQENVRNPGSPSQFYIKRLAGLPADKLRIDAPILFIDGEPASAPSFRRVMSMKDGYHGYSNTTAGGMHFRYLGSPDSIFTVPDASYFALGDNSYHSSDSRDWGAVPQKNLVGRGLFVYWPFTSHWGFIK